MRRIDSRKVKRKDVKSSLRLYVLLATNRDDRCTMKLLITGANGFLGKYVVAEALRRGHSVRAMVRSPKDAEKNGWLHHPKIELALADLRKRKGLADAIRGVDAVLHLAAAKAGDMYAQYGGTVVATEHLLSAMEEAG